MGAPVLIHTSNDGFLDRIKDLVGDISYDFRLTTNIEDINSIEKTYKPLVAIIDVPQDKADLLKSYEVIYDKFRNAKIICVFENVLPFDPEQLGGRKQNMTFLQFHFESELLLNLLLEYAPIEIPNKKLKMEHLNPISLSDIRPSDKFGFDLYFYMPLNKKILLYRKKNSTLTENQIQNFQKFRIHDLYVRKNEMGSVRQYFSNKLKNTFGNKNIPKTEQKLQLQKQVKDIFGSFFNPSSFTFAQCKIIQETCKEVVGKFIMEVSPQPEIYEKILHYTAHNKGNYSHAVNVSVYSALFAMALGLDDIEAASIGGLLHDIGISSLPGGVADITFDEMSEEDKRIYKTHTDSGVKLLENKKLISAENVKHIVSQHHERMDGAGYPQGLKKEKINPYARVCQIADELDELTSVRKNGRLLSPSQAFTKILEENSDSLGNEKFDNEMLEQLKAVLMPPNELKLDDQKVTDIFSRPVSIKDPNAPADEDLRRRKRPKKASLK